MQHGMQGHVAAPRERMPGTEVVWTLGRATRVHADARVAPCGMKSFGLADDGPMG